MYDTAELIELCTTLREECNELRSEVTEPRRRVASVEETLTEEQILKLKKQENKTRVCENKIVPKAETSTVNELSEEDVSEVSENLNDFRLPKKQRKQIQNGKIPTHKKKNNPKKEVTGASELQHQIKAAAPVTAQGETKTAYVYIGNLEKDTEEEDLRRHLTVIGVQYTLDVIRLNSRSSKSSSFCVIVDNKTNEDKLYNSDNWPTGTRIRPYRETQTHYQDSQRRNPSQRRRYQHTYSDYNYWDYQNWK